MQLDDILQNILKPGRYIGSEWNVSKKDFERSDIRFALCFPDLYEVGMSNLGLRIIYGILNQIPDVCCERFFSVGEDLAQALRLHKKGIFSLESKRELADFDLIGFSLGYELGYTNVLEILDLGEIPLEASCRNNSHPLVIGGGPCTMNPEPMHAFFDLFVIGEAEDAIVEIINAYRTFKPALKKGAMSRHECLIALSGIEGVYVPSLYEVTYGKDNAIEAFKPRIEGIPARIKKRIVSDLNTSYFPLAWLVPYIQIIHDRITVEIMRGCPNRCRFCQARSQYYPFRQRKVSEVLRIASEAYRLSGYEEVSLAGLSVSDYCGIEDLLSGLIGFFKPKGVSVSLPSIKPKSMVGGLSSLISTIKKTGLTFAPEAATEKLRQVLNKDFNEQEFFATLEQSYQAGYQHVKLYFMIGLPYEEDTDLDAILDLSLKVSDLRKKVMINGKRCPASQVNISVNALIPKPHTPFQWLAMQPQEAIEKKQQYLRNKLRHRRLKLNFHDTRMSFLEGVLSRGDRRLSGVILSAFRQGARFDAWSDFFRFDIWMSAFQEARIIAQDYLKERAKSEFLPWDFIDTGQDKKTLLGEAP